MNNKFYCDSGCTSHAHISLDSICMGSEYYTDLGAIFEEINRGLNQYTATVRRDRTS